MTRSKAAASTKLQRKAARFIGTSSGAKGAGVLLAPKRFGGILGAEFGGGRRPRTRQFPPHLGRQGYFVYPTVRAFAAGDAGERFADEVLVELAKGPVRVKRRLSASVQAAVAAQNERLG